VIEASLRTYLLADEDVTDVIGDRIFPGERPQKSALPAIVYRRVTGPRVRHLRGPAGLAHPTIELECWAATVSEAKALAELVRLSRGPGDEPFTLEAFAGTMGEHQVQATNLLDDADDLERPAHGEEGGPHRVTMDLVIWFEEPKGA
jgi:hypothetical protein